MGVFFKCDLHSWMSAWVHVMEHPWHGVTKADGKTIIRGLPEGTYEFTVWHELLRGKRQSVVEVTVKKGEKKTVPVKLKRPERKKN